MMSNRFITFTASELKQLDRKRLQLLCKVFGLECRSKTSSLAAALSAVAEEDGGTLKLVPFSTDEKEDTLQTVKEREPIQIALSKFRSQSVGRLYEIQRETKGRSARNIKTEEDGAKEYFPSVTTVLDRTKTYGQRIALLRWKEAKIRELGKEGFKAMSRDILSSGSGFHKVSAQNVLIGKRNIHRYYSSGGEDKETHLGAMLSDHLKEWAGKTPPPSHADLTAALKKDSGLYNLVSSVSSVLDQVTHVFAIESSIQHPLLRYAGTLDCILELDGKICLVDWKTSSKYRRTLDSLYDYPIQAVAYAGAANFDRQYNFQTKHVGLAIAYEDGSPADLHILSPEQCTEYWLMWLSRLSAFYKDFPWETFQTARTESEQAEKATTASITGNVPVVEKQRQTVGHRKFKMTNFLTLSRPYFKKYLSLRNRIK